MEDERNQGGEEEGQGLVGGVLLPPDPRPDRFEVPAQSLVGPFHLERQGGEAFLQAGQDNGLLILSVMDVLQHAAAVFAPAQHGAG